MAEALNFLIVEDNPIDIRIISKALNDMKSDNYFSFVSNVEDALKYLRKEGQYENEPTPDRIILDLRLQGADGFTLLDKMSKDDMIPDIKATVLTASVSEKDKKKAEEIYGCCFVSKPLSVEEFVVIVQNLDSECGKRK